MIQITVVIDLKISSRKSCFSSAIVEITILDHPLVLSDCPGASNPGFRDRHSRLEREFSERDTGCRTRNQCTDIRHFAQLT